MEEIRNQIKKTMEVDKKIVLPLLKTSFKTEKERQQSYNLHCSYIWGLHHFGIISVDEACEMISEIAGVYYGNNS